MVAWMQVIAMEATSWYGLPMEGVDHGSLLLFLHLTTQGVMDASDGIGRYIMVWALSPTILSLNKLNPIAPR